MIWQVSLVLFGLAAIVAACGYAIPKIRKQEVREIRPSPEQISLAQLQEQKNKEFLEGLENIMNYNPLSETNGGDMS